MFGIFKKKTREQIIEKRVHDTITTLLKLETVDFTDVEFTELETIQILNSVRRKLSEHYEAKKKDCQEKSLEYQQKAEEIKNALVFLT